MSEANAWLDVLRSKGTARRKRKWPNQHIGQLHNEKRPAKQHRRHRLPPLLFLTPLSMSPLDPPRVPPGNLHVRSRASRGRRARARTKRRRPEKGWPASEGAKQLRFVLPLLLLLLFVALQHFLRDENGTAVVSSVTTTQEPRRERRSPAATYDVTAATSYAGPGSSRTPGHASSGEKLTTELLLVSPPRAQVAPTTCNDVSKAGGSPVIVTVQLP